jgi:enamine deaminase RidA (YjgF/YER057c/UK114 family)
MLDVTPAELGFELPPPPTLPDDLPIVTHVQVGAMIHVSGQIPDAPGLPPLRGRLGDDVDIDTGRDAARRAMLNALAVLQDAAGGLDEVRRIVKVVGFVRSTHDFTDHPTVMNAASDLLVALWGPENGKHARSAVGVASLPFGVPVEIELIAELEDFT